MSVVFPNSNLPTSSQPWGREITKQLSNIISSSTSSQINNAARDNQLNSSIIAVTGLVNEVSVVAEEASDAAIAAQSAADAAASAAATANSAANQANTAINGLIGLGSDGSLYTLRAGNITSGGVRDGVLNLTSGSNSSIQLFNGGVDINGPAAQLRVGTAGNGGTTVEGAFRVNGGNIRAPGITATQFLQSEAQSGASTVAANITAAGTVIRSGSSRKIKQDITDLDVSYEDILLLQPKKFRLKQEVLENKDARYYPGFIAEDVHETSLKDFVAYDVQEDGALGPSGIYYAELTAALVEAIKHQDTLIKSLTERITLLEGDKVQ